MIDKLGGWRSDYWNVYGIGYGGLSNLRAIPW